MKYLSRKAKRKPSYTLRDVIPLPVPQGEIVRIVTPEGDVKEPSATPEDSLFYDAAEIPGFYRIRAGDRKDYFAVNISPEESDLSTIAPEEVFRELVHPDTGLEISENELTSTLNIQLEKTQQLWWYILLMVFVLGIIETLLAVRTYR